MNHHRRSAQVWHVFSRDFTVLPAHPHVHPQSEWAIPAFAFPAAAGTHLPTHRRDGRLSRPWCEVAQAEIRTRNLPIANLALYHTATSAVGYHCGLPRVSRGCEDELQTQYRGDAEMLQHTGIPQQWKHCRWYYRWCGTSVYPDSRL